MRTVEALSEIWLRIGRVFAVGRTGLAVGLVGLSTITAEAIASSTQAPAMAVATSRYQPLPTKPPNRFLTQPEIKRIRQTMQREIKTSLDLVGLGKSRGYPPAYSSNLRTYRSGWAKVNPEVAPFLGQWVWNWETFPPDYSLTVFPSTTKGRVCLLEQNIGYDVNALPVPKEVPLPPRLSIAQVFKGSGSGALFQFDRALIQRVKLDWTPREIEFIAVVDRQKKHQVYASKDVPILPGGLPEPILKSFKANGCISGGIVKELPKR